MIVTLRVFLGMLQDWKTGNLWSWGVRPSLQTYRQHLEPINFWTFRIFSNFFFKKVDFLRCRRSIFWGKGVRNDKNIFLRWYTLIRSKTPRQTKKSNGTSLWRYKSILISHQQQIHVEISNCQFENSLIKSVYTYILGKKNVEEKLKTENDVNETKKSFLL